MYLMDTTTKIESRLNLLMKIQSEEFLRRREIYRGEELETFEDLAVYYPNDEFTNHARRLSYLAEMPGLLQLVAERGRALRVLDAGCGIGSQSLLFGVLGATVVGIDILPERLNLALRRKEYYEGQIGEELAVEFVNRDIFKAINELGFDLIWLREAISHIHPIEDFFKLAFKRLNKGGLLLISDANWSNPLVKLESYKDYWRNYRPLRRGESSVYFVTYVDDPSTGEKVEFAMERVFTLNALLKKVKNSGFTIIQAKTIGFMPKSSIVKLIASRPHTRIKLYNFLAKLEKAIGSLPIIKRYGTVNVVLAQK